MAAQLKRGESTAIESIYDRYGHAGLRSTPGHDFHSMNVEDIFSMFNDIFSGGMGGGGFGASTGRRAGAAFEATFARRGDHARWTSPEETGERDVHGPALYIPYAPNSTKIQGHTCGTTIWIMVP